MYNQKIQGVRKGNGHKFQATQRDRRSKSPDRGNKQQVYTIREEENQYEAKNVERQ